MIKLIKLIYINLLSLLDYNKIIIASNNNVKSGYEYKPILIVILSIVYGYISYVLLITLGNVINDKTIILNIIFIFTTILSLIISIYCATNTLYNSEDNEYLYSLPIKKNYIILSKLFNIYIKSILFIIIFLISGLLAYNNYVKVDETLSLIYLLIALFIPIIPIIIASIISFIINYIKTKEDKKINTIVTIIILLIISIIAFLIITNKSSNIETNLKVLTKILSYIYPIYYLYRITILHNNLITLFIYITLIIVLLHYFTKYLSKNYIRICSLLNGIKKIKKFEYPKIPKYSKLSTFIHKEYLTIMNDKKYFNTSFRTSISLTIALLLLLSLINIDKITEIENFNAYFNTFIPLLLSFMVCVNSSTISSISIERENLELLKSYPINFKKILLAKFLTGFFFHLIFIIINALIITIFFRPTLFTIIMCYITPIIASIFSNLLYLTLDYKYPAKNEKNETNIINQRILSFIPPIIGIIIGFTQLFLPILNNYVVVVLTHTVVLFILIIILFTYLIINNKKLYDNLTR